MSPGSSGAMRTILVGVSLMLALSMGLRQSLGVFMPPLTREIEVSVSQFTLAVAIQNLVWGVLQPFVGALAVRIGFRRVTVAGAATYALGMALLASAQGRVAVTVGAGVAVGVALACTGAGISMALAARAAPSSRRSMILGIVSAAGSLGAVIAAPIGQSLAQAYGWRAGVWGFFALALVLVPAAWIASRGDDRVPAGEPVRAGASAWAVTTDALRHAPFVVMAVAYFVCGMQLVFLTTHLPSYLDLCGMDPMLSAHALATIGLFNVLGSLFFGWAGGRWDKLVLLGTIYTLRSAIIAAYFLSAPTPATTLVFAGAMGFLWLGVAPLVAGYVGQTFGIRWQAMLGGIAFAMHQFGSFVGAFGGGHVFETMGSYSLALQFGVALGLVAGVTQLACALTMSSRPFRPRAAG